MSQSRILKYSILVLFIFQIPLLWAQNEGLELKKIRSKKLVKNIENTYNQYTNCSYKISAEITLKDKKHKLNVSYRNYRDSLIWLNVSHGTGIPVARFLITPDSTKFMNRIEKKYMILSNEEIQDAFGYDLDFETIQSIFAGELIKLEPCKSLSKNYAHYKVYPDSGNYLMQNIRKSKVRRLIKKDKIDQVLFHQVWVDANYKLVKNNIEDHIEQQTMLINYDNYQQKDTFFFPKMIAIALQDSTQSLDVKLKIKRAKYNAKKMSCSFKIPKRYELKSLTYK